MANITKIRISGSTYSIIDETAIHSLAGYSTTSEMNAAITAATDALAESIAEPPPTARIKSIPSFLHILPLLLADIINL